MKATPFELIATLIFVLALLHTFMTPLLYDLSKVLEKKMRQSTRHYQGYHITFEIVSLLSEVEIALGIWLIPLMIAYLSFHGFGSLEHFLNNQQYGYPLFMMVIVVVVGSKPLIIFAEKLLERVARIGKDSGASWWWTILTVIPLLGLFIKESGAMALAAILLGKKFYQYKPSKPFQYITLVLTLSNIAVAGLIAAVGTRSLFIVYDHFGWDSTYMFLHFGWKALLGMAIVNGLTYLYFKKEFQLFPKRLPTLDKDELGLEPPFIVTLIHILFLVAIVFVSDSPPLFIAFFILFLAFYKATSLYQSKLKLRPALLIGIFFLSILIYGEFQDWWVKPLLNEANHGRVFLTSFLLSAFLDNAVVNYFSVGLSKFDTYKAYFVVTGAMSSSALTIMSNLPNAIAFSLLRPSFHKRISFVTTFLYALFPAITYLLIFWFLA